MGHENSTDNNQKTQQKHLYQISVRQNSRIVINKHKQLTHLRTYRVCEFEVTNFKNTKKDFKKTD